MFHSIRWRIALPYVLLILLTMLGLGIYISNFVRQTYLNDLERQLTSQARLASEIIAPELENNPDPVILDAQARRWAQTLGMRITIIAADGIVLGESDDDRTQMDNHLNRPEIQQAMQNGQGASTRYSQTLGKYLMYVATPIRVNEKTLGFLRVALPLSTVENNLQHLQRTLSLVTFMIAALAIGLALWIATRSMRPLRALTETVSQISSGDLEHVELINPPAGLPNDEIGQLTQAFNTMAVHLRTQITALETERSKIAAVLAEMTDGILIADAQGNVQLINAAAAKMFGVNSHEAPGRSLAAVLRHHQIVELWQDCQADQETQAAAVEINPQKLYLQCIAIPLGEALPGSILLLFQDLTRLRRLETVRQDFISNISHELRTPLASLKALTETLLESALEDPPAARRFLQRMETEVDALSLMVSELLELSRIESGRVPLKLHPTVPEELVIRSVERLRLQAERAGLGISILIRPGLPFILADPARLEQVLVNLLHNAIKFTPSGGKIEVQAEPAAGGDQIIFSVKDTGAGISANDLQRIFERFYKTDRARSGGGTGLGLAIAKHMVEAHGGKIWAESVEGQGSVFFFSIPIAV